MHIKLFSAVYTFLNTSFLFLSFSRGRRESTLMRKSVINYSVQTFARQHPVSYKKSGTVTFFQKRKSPRRELKNYFTTYIISEEQWSYVICTFTCHGFDARVLLFSRKWIGSRHVNYTLAASQSLYLY